MTERPFPNVHLELPGVFIDPDAEWQTAAFHFTEASFECEGGIASLILTDEKKRIVTITFAPHVAVAVTEGDKIVGLVETEHALEAENNALEAATRLHNGEHD